MSGPSFPLALPVLLTGGRVAWQVGSNGEMVTAPVCAGPLPLVLFGQPAPKQSAPSLCFCSPKANSVRQGEGLNFFFSTHDWIGPPPAPESGRGLESCKMTGPGVGIKFSTGCSLAPPDATEYGSARERCK